MNEELQAVNNELQANVDELSHTNNDMKNLLDSTDIVTLFLDNALLCVRRFTAQTSKITQLISSDVGRPITNIASALLYPQLAEDAREVLRTLVKQLLTFARKTEPSWQAVSINQIIEELMKLFAETFPKTIEVKTKMEMVPFILGDAGQLHQVLLNLCVNARDAMPNGGLLTIQTDTMAGNAVRLLLPQASNLEYTRIKISDTGTGMSEATIKRIFDPFFTTKEF